MAGGGIFSQKISQFLEFFLNFTSLYLNFPCYYCSIYLKRQLEHSGLRPDTSSLVLIDARFEDLIFDVNSLQQNIQSSRNVQQLKSY